MTAMRMTSRRRKHGALATGGAILSWCLCQNELRVRAAFVQDLHFCTFCGSGPTEPFPESSRSRMGTSPDVPGVLDVSNSDMSDNPTAPTPVCHNANQPLWPLHDIEYPADF